MSILTYAPLLLKGTGVTIGAWILSGIISISIGIFFGILSCNQLKNNTARFVISWYTFIAKGVPAYVQILIAYFVLPALLGLSIPAFIAAIGALSFCSGGYITEIIRSGINAIPQGQWDACFVLGYPLQATLSRIILPQVFKNNFTILLGEVEQLLKSTSLFATIGITELTRTGANIISREMNPITIYLIIASIYLLLSALLQLSKYYFERSTSYGKR